MYGLVFGHLPCSVSVAVQESGISGGRSPCIQCSASCCLRIRKDCAAAGGPEVANFSSVLRCVSLVACRCVEVSDFGFIAKRLKRALWIILGLFRSRSTGSEFDMGLWIKSGVSWMLPCGFGVDIGLLWVRALEAPVVYVELLTHPADLLRRFLENAAGFIDVAPCLLKGCQ